MSVVGDPQLIPLGLAGALLGFVFRTIWRQDSGWQSVMAAVRQDAADARADAAAARSDAAAARADATAARNAESVCRVLIAEQEARIRELEARNDRHPEEPPKET